MIRKYLTAAAVALSLAATTIPAMAQESNPFLSDYTTEYQIPPFDKIKTSDFIPAIKAGIAEQEQNINNIIRNRAVPDFDNTILPLENLSPILDRVSAVFYLYDGALSTDEFAQMSEEAIPLLNQASNQMILNDLLFQRIKQVYDNRTKLGMNKVQQRVTEKYYRQFAEMGAALSPEKKAELVKVNDELSRLFIQFNKNLLKATNDFKIVVYDKEDLAGLPASSIAQAAEEAKARGLDGLWVFTLHAPSRLPVLQAADNRGLREAMYRGYTTLATYGDTNNYPVIEQIIKLRAEKAHIMGFDNFAQMMTSRVMAKTPEAAENLLMQVFEPAVKRSAEEVKEMQAYVDANGGNFKIAPWDYYYYADKVKQSKYNFDESEIRPYLAVDNVLKGLFNTAERLYGIKMVEMPNAPKYMDQVTVYDVQDAKTGEHVAVFMTDYFPRASKRQGAWMEQMQSCGLYADGKTRRPIVYNVGNFTPPSGDTPALLTLDELETTFHEFGHALQAILSQAPYRSLAGTNVDRDYVEMCSQINEHWGTSPEVMKGFAKHYKTGDVIPDELIERMQAAGAFNQGFTATELAGAALLDLNWGKHNGENVNVPEFEKQVAEKIGMPEEITYRYRSPYFKHIFGDDGYASGYYTYLWSQVLEADGWELFEEKGIFDPKTAASFKKNILESGDTEDAMVLFKRFRGHEPDVHALLRLRGFEPKKAAKKGKK
ncbi:MAG: M3 family metallopeptidase [Bacteroidales bacterium]|nr:M3 family metallopeptidase [Bacteroidales bacterium]MBD5211665.1 M3 family metallopeptidase [Bacteroidales bacterium]MBD5213186.1 M3 family metallopeptidase [Bacteroidales bacterium]